MNNLVAVAWRIARRRNDLEGLLAIEREAARIARHKAQFQKNRADRFARALVAIAARVPTPDEATCLSPLALASRLALIGIEIDAVLVRPTIAALREEGQDGA